MKIYFEDHTGLKSIYYDNINYLPIVGDTVNVHIIGSKLNGHSRIVDFRFFDYEKNLIMIGIKDDY